MVIDMLSQTVGLGVAHQAVIAVEGGQHALEQGRRCAAVGMAHGVVGQPFAPFPLHGRRGPRVTLGCQQVAEPGDAPPQRPHRPLADEPMVRMDDAAEKIDPLRAALQHHLAGVQFEPQAFMQKTLDPGFPAEQRLRIVGQQHEIVHIAHITAHLEAVLDELVELVEIDIGEELAGQAAYGQANAGWGAAQRFVRRYLCQQGHVAASLRRRVDGGLGEDGGGDLIEPPPRGDRPGQAGQGLLPQSPQDAPVNAREKGADVELASPAVPRLAHQSLQALNGGVCALAFSIGERIVDEARIPPGFDVPHQPLLHQPVSEGGREDFAQLGVGHGKDGEGLRLVAARGDRRSLLEHNVGQTDEMRALVLAVAGFGSTLEKLAGNLGFGQGV